MTLLVGRNVGGVTADFTGNGNTAVVDFVAALSGSVTSLSFHIKVANAGITSVNLAAYGDNGSGTAPSGARLALVNITTGVTGTGIISGSVTPFLVTAGVIYWLGWEGNGEQFDWQGENTGQYIEVSGGSFGDPWAGGGSPTTNHEPIIWADGDAAAPAPIRTFNPIPFMGRF